MSAESELISLDKWASRVYGDDMPHMNTLRRWAAEGRIYPRPRKHGRAYKVRPDAVYVDPNNPQSLAEAMEELNGRASTFA